MNLPTPPPPQPPHDKVVKGECVNCGWKDRWLLHRVLLRGADRRVCTSCVLRLHPSTFCPSCFEFFDHPLSATSSAASHRFISCIKCSSLTHLRCLPSPPPPTSSFLCPPCSKPNFTFFPVPESPLDKNLAAVLLCASKVAAASMAKTLAISRIRADRAVREATVAGKRVKETLECYNQLECSLEASGSMNLEPGTPNYHQGMYKKVVLNGFHGGEDKVKILPSEVLNIPANKIGVSGNPVMVKVKDELASDERLVKIEQDLERSKIVDVTSTT